MHLMACSTYIGLYHTIHYGIKVANPRNFEIFILTQPRHCKFFNHINLRELIKTENDGVIEEWEAKKVKRLKSNKDKQKEKEDLVMED